MTVAHEDLACELHASDDPTLSGLVMELRELTREATLDLSLRVGRLIIERCYKGDLNAWRRRGKKVPTLRALARRDDLPMSASALYRSIALFELSARVGGLSPWRHLGVSHLRAVLPLAWDAQSQILSLAETERWTVARVEQETALRRSGSSSGGRPRLPQYIKALRRLEQHAKVPEPFARAESDLARLDDATLQRLRETLTSLMGSLAGLQRAVEQQCKGPRLADGTADPEPASATTSSLDSAWKHAGSYGLSQK